MTYVSERITVNPEQCGGRPCVRGMRIRVTDVLDLFSAGLSAQEILDEMPDLDEADLKARLKYASKRIAQRGQGLEIRGIKRVMEGWMGLGAGGMGSGSHCARCTMCLWI